MKVTKHPRLALAAAIVGLGLILGIRFQYELFAAYLYTLFGLFCLVPCAFIVAAIALISFLLQRRIGNVLGYALVISGSLTLALIVFYGIGVVINRWKISATERYVERAVVVLDKIKQREGSYPGQLPVEQLGEPPELL